MTDEDTKILRTLKDIEDIRRLKHRYATLCDANYDPDGLAALFTEDGQWNGGAFGTHHGRDEIHAFFTRCGRDVEFAVHYMLNDAIDVSGDTAKGSWYLWQIMTMNTDPLASYWLSASYDDTYVRRDGVWMKHICNLNILMFTPYGEGPAINRLAPSPV